MLTYNRSSYLKIALDSILNQTYSNFTLIILDNMSTDETEGTVKCIKDERILYIKRSSGKYPNNEFYAFDVNITPFFVIFHDDDIIEKENLEKMTDIMIIHDYYAVSACTSSIIDSLGNVTSKFVKKNDYSLYQGRKHTTKFI